MISFLHPLALIALAAGAIPALLHLRSRRLPPVVIFPAIRYLTATEREHSRRLKLRNLLLLLLRTLVIVFLVLAAARPILRLASGRSHPPSAIVLVVDNSLSSGAVVQGRLMLELIRDAAREALSQTNSGDHIWVVLADGVPQRVTRLEAAGILDHVVPLPIRLDLGKAVRIAARTLADDPLDGKRIVVFSDLQRSAVTRGEVIDVPVLIPRIAELPVNRWIDSMSSQPPLWSPDGTVAAAVGGTDDRTTTVRLHVAGRVLDRTVAGSGDQVVLAGQLDGLGWAVASVELDPDELRADDVRFTALFSAQPAAATALSGAGEFVSEALQVLQDGGRATGGTDVVIGDRPVQGTVVLFPPADPALLGAINRTLADLGVQIQYGELLDGEWQVAGDLGAATGSTVFRRYRIIGSGTVFAEVANEPWLARDGEVVLVGSRMEPEWTELPVSAGFVPFLDQLINQVAARQTWVVAAAPGEVVAAPPGASELLGSNGASPIPGDHRLVAPLVPGVYFLRDAAGDTVGALELNPDVRESMLEPVDDRTLRTHLGQEAMITSRQDLSRLMFVADKRADLTWLLLWAALLAAVAEFAIANAGRSGRRRP